MGQFNICCKLLCVIGHVKRGGGGGGGGGAYGAKFHLEIWPISHGPKTIIRLESNFSLHSNLWQNLRPHT